MIELLRYARMKLDPTTVPATKLAQDGLVILFKRFDVSNGKEVSSEESYVTFRDLEERLIEAQVELEVIKELLALKPK